jgi:hypothetical protein
VREARINLERAVFEELGHENLASAPRCHRSPPNGNAPI